MTSDAYPDAADVAVVVDVVPEVAAVADVDGAPVRRGAAVVVFLTEAESTVLLAAAREENERDNCKLGEHVEAHPKRAKRSPENLSWLSKPVLLDQLSQ